VFSVEKSLQSPLKSGFCGSLLLIFRGVLRLFVVSFSVFDVKNRRFFDAKWRRGGEIVKRACKFALKNQWVI
jgi:hypothetical protein